VRHLYPIEFIADADRRPLASTGAVLMIIALGIAPVTQQALTYETRLRNSSTSASTLSPRATTYSDFDINNRGPAGQ
jgi:hypothetical protein